MTAVPEEVHQQRHDAYTDVPADVFDAPLTSLDEPDDVNSALAKAAKRSHERAAEV